MIIRLKIQSGRKKFEFLVEDDSINILRLKELLSETPDVEAEAKNMKLIINKKVRKNTDLLNTCYTIKDSEKKEIILKCTLLFEKGHFDQLSGKDVLNKSTKILEKLEKQLKDIKSRAKAGMISIDDHTFEVAPVKEKLLQVESELKQSKQTIVDEIQKNIQLEWVNRLHELLDHIKILLQK